MGIMDVIGPIMIGPSSSHTAGAAKIGFLARLIYGKEINQVVITLYNSFAKTGKGHGTDKAIIGGILGMKMDDERIPRSFDIAKEKGLTFHFQYVQDPEKHPNETKIEIIDNISGEKYSISGYSIGGGNAKIDEINGIKVDFSGKHDMLLVSYNDVPGMIGYIGEVLGDNHINIAYVQISRDASIGKAMAILKLDDFCSEDIVAKLCENKNIINAISFPRLGGTLS
jgi:L-serine dehydratase